jgi:signal peptidase I
MTTHATPATERSRARRLLAEYLPVVVMLVLLMAARDSLANHYKVPSGSMEPTLVPGDRVVVDMRAYGVRLPFTEIELRDGASPQPGDVVVFASPDDGTRLIKRLVAVGGQTVALSDGRLWIDGLPLRIDGQGEAERFDERIAQLNLRDGGGPDIAPTRIPEGMALVLGDHRGNSADGRYFGLVPIDALYGKAIAVYYRSGQGFGWIRL